MQLADVVHTFIDRAKAAVGSSSPLIESSDTAVFAQVLEQTQPNAENVNATADQGPALSPTQQAGTEAVNELAKTSTLAPELAVLAQQSDSTQALDNLLGATLANGHEVGALPPSTKNSRFNSKASKAHKSRKQHNSSQKNNALELASAQLKTLCGGAELRVQAGDQSSAEIQLQLSDSVSVESLAEQIKNSLPQPESKTAELSSSDDKSLIVLQIDSANELVFSQNGNQAQILISGELARLSVQNQMAEGDADDITSEETTAYDKAPARLAGSSETKKLQLDADDKASATSIAVEESDVEDNTAMTEFVNEAIKTLIEDAGATTKQSDKSAAASTAKSVEMPTSGTKVQDEVQAQSAQGSKSAGLRSLNELISTLQQEGCTIENVELHVAVGDQQMTNSVVSESLQSSIEQSSIFAPTLDYVEKGLDSPHIVDVKDSTMSEAQSQDTSNLKANEISLFELHTEVDNAALELDQLMQFKRTSDDSMLGSEQSVKEAAAAATQGSLFNRTSGSNGVSDKANDVVAQQSVKTSSEADTLFSRVHASQTPVVNATAKSDSVTNANSSAAIADSTPVVTSESSAVISNAKLGQKTLNGSQQVILANSTLIEQNKLNAGARQSDSVKMKSDLSETTSLASGSAKTNSTNGIQGLQATRLSAAYKQPQEHSSRNGEQADKRSLTERAIQALSDAKMQLHTESSVVDSQLTTNERNAENPVTPIIGLGAFDKSNTVLASSSASSTQTSLNVSSEASSQSKTSFAESTAIAQAQHAVRNAATTAGDFRNAALRTAENLSENMPRTFRVPIEQLPNNAGMVIRSMQEAQEGQARLILRPEALGTVVVNLNLQEQVRTVHMEVANDAARQAVESQIGQLHAELARNGVQVDTIRVSVRESEQNNTNTSAHQHSSQQKHEDREARTQFLRSFEQRKDEDASRRERNPSRQLRDQPRQRRQNSRNFEQYA